MVEGPRGVTVLASLSPRAHVEGFEGRVMGWGLGGVSRQAGLLLLQRPPPPPGLEAAAPRGTRVWSAKPGPGLG